MGVLEDDAKRKLWYAKCAAACDSHDFPSKGLNISAMTDTGMKFMILDELAEIRKSLNNTELNTQLKQLQADIEEFKDQLKSK